MGKTVTRKILEKGAGKTLEPGEYVVAKPDLVNMSEVYWLWFKGVLDQVGVDRPWDPSRFSMVIDHAVQNAIEPNYQVMHSSMREYAKKYGCHFTDVGRGGVRQQVIIEQGLIRPGMLLFSDEPNHANIGALGSVNLAINIDMIMAIPFGEAWIRAPDDMRFILKGELKRGITSRDLAHRIVGDIGQIGARGAAADFGGPGLKNLSMDQRMNLCAFAYRFGAVTATSTVDGLARKYISESALDMSGLIMGDEDVAYRDTMEYDLSALEPCCITPNEGPVKTVGDLEGTPITEACIASCCGARIDDLRAAAAILKGRKVHAGVRMYITPITQLVYKQAMHEGLMDTFLDVGASVLTPSCSTCFGYQGYMDKGEVQISTHTQTFAERNGVSGSESYLANPYVVAASAVEGKITDPRTFLE